MKIKIPVDTEHLQELINAAESWYDNEIGVKEHTGPMGTGRQMFRHGHQAAKKLARAINATKKEIKKARG